MNILKQLQSLLSMMGVYQYLRPQRITKYMYMYMKYLHHREIEDGSFLQQNPF